MLITSVAAFFIYKVRQNDVAELRRILERATMETIRRYLTEPDRIGMTALHWASHGGETQTMLCLIADYSDQWDNTLNEDMSTLAGTVIGLPVIVDGEDYSQLTPIDILIKRGDNDIIKQIRERLPDKIDYMLCRGRSTVAPMHRAATSSGIETLQSLLHNTTFDQRRVLLNERNDQGWTSLHVACIKGDKKMMEYILQMLPTPSDRAKIIREADNDGKSPLHRLLDFHEDPSEQVSVVMEMLPSADRHLSTTQQDNNRWTLIHICAKYDCVSTMKLIMSELDSNEEEKWELMTLRDVEGQTALHIAASNKRAKTVIMILEYIGREKRAELLAQRDEADRTPLERVDDFSPLGKYMDFSTRIDCTPVHVAVMNDDTEFLNWIFDNTENADRLLRTFDRTGNNPLHTAVILNRLKVIGLLLEKAANVPEYILSKNEENVQNALHISARNNSLNILLSILRNVHVCGFQKQLIQEKTSDGLTCRDIARDANHHEVEGLLSGKINYSNTQVIFSLAELGNSLFKVISGVWSSVIFPN